MDLNLKVFNNRSLQSKSQ